MAIKNSEMYPNRFAKWAYARRKLAFIKQNVEAGRKAYVTTALKVTVITMKTIDSVRVTKHGGLELQSGKNWLDCNWCKISAQ